MSRRFAWASLPDEELLQLRLQDLHVTVEGTWVERCMVKLYDELEERGVNVRPHVWLSDEWFSPDNTPGIAIPFYLAHPRLMRLERKMIIDVEGGTRARVHAHPAPRSRPRGAARLRAAAPPPLAGIVRPLVEALSELLPPNPSSKNFVQHLRAAGTRRAIRTRISPRPSPVWLTPRSDWRKRYADWPALKKLEYVDELMGEIAGEKPLLTRAPSSIR